MVGASGSFDALLRHGALLVLAGAAVWGGLVLAAVLVEGISAGRIAAAPRLGCPERWHRWLLATATALLAGTLLAPPASADASPDPTVLEGLALPDRSAGVVPHSTGPDLRAREPPTVSAEVTVRPGDSLWAISRRLLPAEASAGSIADLTRTLSTLNRSTIGDDPDLIRPGQRLHVPPVPHETYSEDS